MSRFNQKAMSAAVEEYVYLYKMDDIDGNMAYATKKMKNNEDGNSFALSKELDLYSRVCTMAMSDRFYETENKSMKSLVRLIHLCDDRFVAKLAVYAREKMYIRSMPLILTIELAKNHRGDSLISDLIFRIVKRADEITDLLAYYQTSNSRDGKTKKLNKLSNQVKKGIRRVFESGRFDEYQYAKYNRKTEVKFRDALFLVHPKPQDKAQEVLFNKIADDTLDTPYTWETQLSGAGQTGDSKKETWESLIDSGKFGYMAMLRNLRNVLNEGVSERHIKIICDTLSDRDMVSKSKQLPFRFLSAFRSLIETRMWGWDSEKPKVDSSYLGQVIRSLETALAYSIDNLPMFQGDSENILIAADVSGSMQKPISPKSTILQYDISLLMAMIAKAAYPDSCSGIFGDSFKVLDVAKSGIDPSKSKILYNVNEMYKREGEVGYSTNGWKVIDHALRNEKQYDRIMIFTDCEMYGVTDQWDYQEHQADIDQLWGIYKNRYPKTKLYLFNLNGYGSVPIRMKDNDVFLISGWSDKIFDIMSRIENGQNAVDEIESISL